MHFWKAGTTCPTTELLFPPILSDLSVSSYSVVKATVYLLVVRIIGLIILERLETQLQPPVTIQPTMNYAEHHNSTNKIISSTRPTVPCLTQSWLLILIRAYTTIGTFHCSLAHYYSPIHLGLLVGCVILIIIVNSRFLQRTQKPSSGNQLIHRR